MAFRIFNSMITDERQGSGGLEPQIQVSGSILAPLW